MSDNLRDRIADALQPDRGCHRQYWLAQADAVIAELGLSEEWSLKSTIYTNPLIHPYRSREEAVADRDGASGERRGDLSLMVRPVGEWKHDD